MPPRAAAAGRVCKCSADEVGGGVNDHRRPRRPRAAFVHGLLDVIADPLTTHSLAFRQAAASVVELMLTVATVGRRLDRKLVDGAPWTSGVAVAR